MKQNKPGSERKISNAFCSINIHIYEREILFVKISETNKIW